MELENEGTRPLVLLHGILMNRWAVCWLARALRRQGIDAHCFGYPSLRRAPAENARRLAAWLERFDGPVDLAAHSLGGIVVAHLLDSEAVARARRVVLLASPVRGSVVARRLARFGVSRWVLGRSIVDGLLDDHATRFTAVAGRVEIGALIGTRGFGVGSLLGGFAGPNDGTVALAETELPGVRDRIELPVSHFTLLFSSEVARQIACFARRGRFCHGRVEWAG